jgi:hypothetical protein
VQGRFQEAKQNRRDQSFAIAQESTDKLSTKHQEEPRKGKTEGTVPYQFPPAA